MVSEPVSSYARVLPASRSRPAWRPIAPESSAGGWHQPAARTKKTTPAPAGWSGAGRSSTPDSAFFVHRKGFPAALTLTQAEGASFAPRATHQRPPGASAPRSAFFGIGRRFGRFPPLSGHAQNSIGPRSCQPFGGVGVPRMAGINPDPRVAIARFPCTDRMSSRGGVRRQGCATAVRRRVASGSPAGHSGTGAGGPSRSCQQLARGFGRTRPIIGAGATSAAPSTGPRFAGQPDVREQISPRLESAHSPRYTVGVRHLYVYLRRRAEAR